MTSRSAVGQRADGALRRRTRPEDIDDPNEHPGITLVCLRCLVDDHPELGRGLDIAREHGVADLGENGEWVVGDLSRLADG
jgi:hypothetical protein